MRGADATRKKLLFSANLHKFMTEQLVSWQFIRAQRQQRCSLMCLQGPSKVKYLSINNSKSPENRECPHLSIIFVDPNRRLSALRTYPLVVYLKRCMGEALERDFAAFFRAYLGPSWRPSWRW